MGGDWTKHCRKIKQIQRVRIGSMGRKRDTARRRDDNNWRRGGIESGKRGDGAS
jgi:hypothetical protein